MSSDAKPSVTPQLVIGVFIMLLGAVLLLDQLDIVSTRQLRPFWPIALIAIGTSMLLRRQDSSGRFWGSIWTAVGAWMLLNMFGWLNLSLGQLIGPLVLILIGVNVMMRTFGGPPRAQGARGAWGCRPRAARMQERAERAAARMQERAGGTSQGFSGDAGAPTVGGGDASAAAAGAETGASVPPPIPGAPARRAIPLQSDPSGSVTLFAVLGEAKRASNDRPFRGGEMTAFMGGCVLDLRQATILPGEQAVVNVLAVMGGHEVWVPHGWAVALDIVPVLGGVDDKRLPPVEPMPENPPRLRLRGVVVMGGLVIKN